jgi:7-cyano-7-deazaguanine synthase
MTTALLLSGGMDSIAVAFWKKPDFAFTVDYGQLSSEGEIDAARAVSESLSIPHEIITVDCRSLGSGDLSGKEPIPSAPATDWWPFRNQLLVTLVGMRAVSLGVDTLLFGTVKTDRIHSDGSPEFFEKLDSLLSLQEGRLRILAPAIDLTTLELIRLSSVPRSLLAWAHSCHVSDFACGGCLGCSKYQAVIEELENETD